MNFNNVYNIAYELYGIKEDPSDLEEIALIAWNKIGNSNSLFTIIEATIDPIKGYYEIPCEYSYLPYTDDFRVEAITNNKEDFRNDNSFYANTKDYSRIEENIERRKTNKHPLYISGKFINFVQDNNKIYFRNSVKEVSILIRQASVDDEGLPYINDKEAYAIATYIAFVLKQKEAWKTNNRELLLFSKEMKDEWLKSCQNARVPQHISQNELDKVLDAFVRGDKKQFNKSYKPAL